MNCMQCNQPIPDNAEFGNGKHMIIDFKFGRLTWCDNCYNKEMEKARQDNSEYT